MEKLSSMKPVPCAEKIRDRWTRRQIQRVEKVFKVMWLTSFILSLREPCFRLRSSPHAVWVVGVPCPWGTRPALHFRTQGCPGGLLVFVFFSWMLSSVNRELKGACALWVPRFRAPKPPPVGREMEPPSAAAGWVEFSWSSSCPYHNTSAEKALHFFFFLTALGVTDLPSAAYAGAIWFDAHLVFCQIQGLMSTGLSSSCKRRSSDEEPVCQPRRCRDSGSVPGSGRSPGEGNGSPLQSSCLEHPMDRGAWWATVYGITELAMAEAT